jgi:hypothetical protein
MVSDPLIGNRSLFADDLNFVMITLWDALLWLDLSLRVVFKYKNMSLWAVKRQIGYLAIFLAAVVVLVGVPILLLVHKEPTCTDGERNQGEVDVDCGGPCEAYCASQAVPLKVLWTRVFKVTDEVYSIVAYIENSNTDAGARNVPYSFKIYDKENILITERRGKIFIAPKQITPIFEGGLPVGSRVPARAFFEFRGEPKWERMSPIDYALLTKNIKLRFEDSAPRLEVTLVNSSLRGIYDVEVVAVIFDRRDNAIAASRTVVDFIDKDDARDLVFTWPEPFGEEVGRIEVTPRVGLQ